MDDLDTLSRGELIALILEQQQLIQQLRLEIEELKRSNHRPAAPFSKGKGKANPKPPGRKPGQGPFTRRTVPQEAPSQIVNAQAPPACPYCGGPLERKGEETATTTDMPEKPQPVITRYVVPVCRCQKCGKRVRGTAPGSEHSSGSSSKRGRSG